MSLTINGISDSMKQQYGKHIVAAVAQADAFMPAVQRGEKQVQARRWVTAAEAAQLAAGLLGGCPLPSPDLRPPPADSTQPCAQPRIDTLLPVALPVLPQVDDFELDTSAYQQQAQQAQQQGAAAAAQAKRPRQHGGAGGGGAGGWDDSDEDFWEGGQGSPLAALCMVAALPA